MESSFLCKAGCLCVFFGMACNVSSIITLVYWSDQYKATPPPPSCHRRVKLSPYNLRLHRKHAVRRHSYSIYLITFLCDNRTKYILHKPEEQDTFVYKNHKFVEKVRLDGGVHVLLFCSRVSSTMFNVSTPHLPGIIRIPWLQWQWKITSTCRSFKTYRWIGVLDPFYYLQCGDHGK